MWPLWLLFLIPAWASLVPGRLPDRDARLAWMIVGLVFAVMMGFRHEVGGDWGAYARHFDRLGRGPLADAFSMGDPGYYGLGWVIAQLGGSVHWLNFACASLLMWGTVAFCRKQPNPWLALLAAVPYMLIVVGMGYTRQSVALGFALLGLLALSEARLRAFVVFVVLGALFHKSAVLLLPIAVIASSKNRWMTMVGILVATALAYYLLLQDSADALVANYVDTKMQSEGASVRAAMNAVPAILLLIWRKRLVPDPTERRLWITMALLAMLCIPMLFLASTAVDRLALYLLPLQMFVFSRVPRLATTTQTRTPLVLAIVAAYAAVLYVWLNYATHASYWLPYQFMPLT